MSTTKTQRKGSTKKKAGPKRPVGRPTTFAQEIADQICERIACGESLRKICEGEDMPGLSTVFRWLYANEAFRDQYTRAREAQQEYLALEILEIADDGSNDTYIDEEGKPRVDHDVIQRSRLRVDTRKWIMSKLAPKKYGDKVDVNHGGQAENPLTLLLQQVQGTALKPVDDEDDE